MKIGFQKAISFTGVKEKVEDIQCDLAWLKINIRMEYIAERDAKIAELKRQAALSDEEWSLEQIEKDVRRYLHIYLGVLDLEQNKIDKYMNFFKELPKVEDIETRLFGGMLQWKYYKNKAWKNVFIPD